ncbi:DUF3108 domain-containing protein [Aestuariispira insulae]|uniref:Uncharacterized protein DUF3108 n=1 Tax=Aestuariispira insulae TaxID=1461337 RepID=A0A3D9HPF3_9PROT|nr:DUF3108 domain-containing protein [Aestuariispira insulae]RED51360.1 uncharacterized protein DUF3108 [Aestuariispira insulae]
MNVPSRIHHHLRNGLFCAVALLGTALPHAASGQKLSLEYEIYFGGMHFVSSSVLLERGTEDYLIKATGQSRGMFDLFIGWEGSAVSAGRITNQGLIPDYHQNEGQWKGRKREIRLDYDPENGPLVTKLLETEQDDAPEVTEVDPDAVKDTYDPISTILDLALKLQGNGCAAEREIYDGRRHYRIHMSDAGTTVIKPSD